MQLVKNLDQTNSLVRKKEIISKTMDGFMD